MTGPSWLTETEKGNGAHMLFVSEVIGHPNHWHYEWMPLGYGLPWKFHNWNVIHDSYMPYCRILGILTFAKSYTCSHAFGRLMNRIFPKKSAHPFVLVMAKHNGAYDRQRMLATFVFWQILKGWRRCLCLTVLGIVSHTIHETGIFTLWLFFNGKCRQIYQSHGCYGFGNFRMNQI